MKIKSRSKPRSKRKIEPTLQKVGLNLPEGKYPWQVLRSVVDDLVDFLDEKHVMELKQFCRQKNFDGYSRFSEAFGLQCIARMDSPLIVKQAYYQVATLLKKFQFPGSDKAQTDAAVVKFAAAENLCREYNHVDYTCTIRNSEQDLAIWGHAKDFIRMVVGKSLPSVDEIQQWARHGPGSTLSTVHGMTSVFFKYSELPYSCTELCLAAAKDLILSDERWFEALLTEFCQKRQIVLYVSILDGKRTYCCNGGFVFPWKTFWSSVIEEVDGNRIAFVPKNALTKRSIAIEPTLNLMLQLGVDGYIRRQLKRFKIDLDDQTVNQEFARQGSIDGSKDSFCTIDLSAASDTISTGICKHLLPGPWFDYLMMLRSPKGQLGEGEISYEKISSMGNGFTFALETLVFASLVYGTMKDSKGPNPVEWGDFAVFGDDIIIRQRYVSTFIGILYKSGFRVNEEKSFTTGNARESCGADWINGYPVRPVYLKDEPQTVRELWSDINRLQKMLSVRFDVDLGEGETFKTISKWIPQIFRGFQGPPSDEDMDSYLHSLSNRHNCRFNRFTQSFQFMRLIEKYEPMNVNKQKSFIYRKLMHDLRPFKSHQFDAIRKIQGSGSRFEIRNVYKTYFYRKFTPTVKWWDTYLGPGGH